MENPGVYPGFLFIIMVLNNYQLISFDKLVIQA